MNPYSLGLSDSPFLICRLLRQILRIFHDYIDIMAGVPIHLAVHHSTPMQSRRKDQIFLEPCYLSNLREERVAWHQYWLVHSLTRSLAHCLPFFHLSSELLAASNCLHCDRKAGPRYLSAMPTAAQRRNGICVFQATVQGYAY